METTATAQQQLLELQNLLNKAVRPRITKTRLARLLGMSRPRLDRRLADGQFTPAELKLLKKHHLID